MDLVYAELTTWMPQWTWEYIDKHMTLPRLKAYYESWKNHTPPIAQSLAALIKFKRKGKKTAKEQFEELRALGMTPSKDALPPSVREKQLKLGIK